MARTDTLTNFLTDVANAIRNKKGTTDAINASDFDSEIESIPSGEELDSSIGYIVLKSKLSGDVNINIPTIITSLRQFAMSAVISGNSHMVQDNLTSITLKSDHDITDMYRTFYSFINNKAFTITLDFDTSKVTNWTQAFTAGQVARDLVGIYGKNGGGIDFSGVASVGDIFTSRLNLAEIRIVPLSIKGSISLGNCSMLSNDSIQSIVDGLAYLEEGQTATLTLHSTVKEKITTEQDALIKAKGWTY